MEKVHEASLSLNITPKNSSSLFSLIIDISLESLIEPLSEIIIFFFGDIFCMFFKDFVCR